MSDEPDQGPIPVEADNTEAARSAHQPGNRDDTSEAEQSKAVDRWRRLSAKRARSAKRPFWVELPILVVVAFALTFLIQTFIAKVYYVPSGSMEKTLHGVASGGDRILASKIVYDFRDPKQGEVIVFKGPDDWAAEADLPSATTWLGKAMQSLGSVVGIAPPNEKDFVKRVIATGGQTVACCDAQGDVTVDGKPLSEPYIYEPLLFQPGIEDCLHGGDSEDYGSQRCFAPFKVPVGQLWVMGDHRSQSSDSSFNCQGLKPAKATAYIQPLTEHQGCYRPIPVANVIGKAIFIVMPPSRWGTIDDPSIDPSAMALGSGVSQFLPAAGGAIAIFGIRGLVALSPTRLKRRRKVKAELRRGACRGR